MLRRYTAPLLLLACWARPVLAQNVEIAVPIGDSTEHLPLPTGYCEVDRSRPAEAAIFERAKTEAVAFAVDCAQLTALRNGQPQYGFKRSIVFQTLSSNGVPQQVDDTGRAQFIRDGAASVPQLDTKAIADQLKQHGQDIGVALAMRTFGLLGQDENAYYTGGISASGGRPVAVVAATTVVGNRPITAAFYEMEAADSAPIALDNVITALYSQARTEAAALIAANGNATSASDATSAPSKRSVASPDLSALAAPHAANPIVTFLLNSHLLELALLGGFGVLIAVLARALGVRR